jgi:hypothetical protein
MMLSWYVHAFLRWWWFSGPLLGAEAVVVISIVQKRDFLASSSLTAQILGMA